MTRIRGHEVLTVCTIAPPGDLARALAVATRGARLHPSARFQIWTTALQRATQLPERTELLEPRALEDLLGVEVVRRFTTLLEPAEATRELLTMLVDALEALDNGPVVGVQARTCIRGWDGLAFDHVELPDFDPRFPHLRDGARREPVALLSQDPALAAVCAAYAQELRGVAEHVSLDAKSDGLDRFARSAVNRGLEEGAASPPFPGDVLDDALTTWLNTPATAGTLVSRYLMEIWYGRPDVQTGTPRVYSSIPDAIRFLTWIIEHGSHEYSIPEPLKPDQSHLESPWAPAPRAHGVRVVGHLRAVFGIGEAARRVADAARESGIPHAAVTYHHERVRVSDADLAAKQEGVEFDTNIACIGADGFTAFAYDFGPEFFADRYTIGVWFWETTSPPPGLADALPYVDELWVASEFIADVLRPHIGDVPIRVMPLAVRAPEPGPASRASLGLPRDAYLYGFMFDFNSTLERKNTLGLVDAYRRAYPEPSADTALIIKSMHGAQNLRELEQLRFAIMDRPDIQLIDEHLSIADRDAMLAAFDCYVSLHRSEGFGLTIAEALLAGVPTIATGYSANVEFAGADECYLVDYELREVPEGLGAYSTRGMWADPDLEHAARLMRHVRGNPDEAAARATAAATRIAEQCSLDAAAAFMRTRLDEIWEERPMPPSDPLPDPDPIGDVERFVANGPEGGWVAGSGGLRRAARRTLLRLMQPYTARRAQLDVDIARSLRHLQQQIDDRDV